MTEPSPLWRRVLSTFYEPASVGAEVAERPRWGGAALLGVVFVVASVLLIPAEIWQAMMRQQLVASGQPIPEGMGENMGRFMQIWGIVGGGLFWVVWILLTASLTTFVLAFVLGDKGGFRQYLAATAHALLIPAVGSLALVPLRVARQDPQLTLNLGTFFGGLESGYFARLLQGMDLFLLWSVVALAIMASRIDPRRSVGSAVGALGTVIVALLALVALIPRP